MTWSGFTRVFFFFFDRPLHRHALFRLGEYAEKGVGVYADDIFTTPASLAGLPALSVPCGQDQAGLPIGVQLMGECFCWGCVYDCRHSCELCMRGQVVAGYPSAWNCQACWCTEDGCQILGSEQIGLSFGFSLAFFEIVSDGSNACVIGTSAICAASVVMDDGTHHGLRANEYPPPPPAFSPHPARKISVRRSSAESRTSVRVSDVLASTVRAWSRGFSPCSTSCSRGIGMVGCGLIRFRARRDLRTRSVAALAAVGMYWWSKFRIGAIVQNCVRVR